MSETQPALSRRMGSGRFPAARIKKIMQEDDDVGKISAEVPAMVSRAAELMLHQIAIKCAEYLQDRAVSTITPAHVKAVLEGDSKFEFFAERLVDIEEDKQSEAPKRKRSRTTAAVLGHE
eukprot:ANDGO_01438.mRNA.1 Dr1-associated corepressor homolog